jgi:hypothetical protein
MSPTIGTLVLQQDPDPFQIVTNFLESPILRIAGQLVLLLFVVLWIALVYWTYTDASRRGALSILWGLVAVVVPYVGTLIYLIVRPPEYLEESRERELGWRCSSGSSATTSICAPTAETSLRRTT